MAIPFRLFAAVLLGSIGLIAAAAQDAGRHHSPAEPPEANRRKWRATVTTEGPAADAQGNVFFTDSPNNRILVLRPGGKVEVWNSKSKDANGMRFDAKGRLVACCGEDGARAVLRFEKDGQITTLADRYDDKRLTAPNDLCFDRQGQIYFTDPCYGRKPKDGQEKFAVYRIELRKGEPIPNKVTRVIDDVDTPNGIALSPDGKTLYVADNAPRKDGPHTLVAYDISADGTCKAVGRCCTMSANGAASTAWSSIPRGTSMLRPRAATRPASTSFHRRASSSA